jgi:agmatinase
MNFLGPENCSNDIRNAGVVILPVPYEFTTSYGKGTRKGPEAIIAASPYLEFYDEELDSEPWLEGVYTDSIINCAGRPEQILSEISARVNGLIRQEKLVITLGGEHSVTLGAYQGVHPECKDISILQLDAHSDLRDSYEKSRFSHACVMRRIWELNRDITGVGIRSQSIEEREFVRENKIKMIYAHQIREKGFEDHIIGRLCDSVYLTIDVDFFDPSIMPSTGTPEPGGFYWNETLNFLNRLFEEKNIIGIDVVELSPNKYHAHADFMIAKLIYKLIGFYSFSRRAK